MGGGGWKSPSTVHGRGSPQKLEVFRVCHKLARLQKHKPYNFLHCTPIEALRGGGARLPLLALDKSSVHILTVEPLEM